MRHYEELIYHFRDRRRLKGRHYKRRHVWKFWPQVLDLIRHYAKR